MSGPGRMRPVLPLAVSAVLLAGCAAAGTAIGQRELDVQTRMTDSIFLDPVPPAERTVLIEVRNTSDRPDLELAMPVRQAVAARGWRVVEDPRQARRLLQVNVLQAGRSSRTAAERSYAGGFGSVVTGAALGGAAGYGAGQLRGGEKTLGIGGALAGAAAATVADAYVRDTTWSVIADLQLSERAPSGLVVSESSRSRLDQGSAAAQVQTSSGTSEWRRYRTRIVGTANRANLDWPEAAPQLAAGLTRSIAGLLQGQ